MQFPALTVPQGEAVYDFCWYPKMNSWEPETCWWATLHMQFVLHHQVHFFTHWCIPYSFVTSCKDHPVHLWDAFYYHRRASYVPHNHLVRTCCILQITQHFPNNGFDVNIQCNTYAQIWRQVLPTIYTYIHLGDVSPLSKRILPLCKQWLPNYIQKHIRSFPGLPQLHVPFNCNH